MPNLKPDLYGNLVFFMCIRCGHVGTTNVDATLACPYCQNDDLDWQLVNFQTLTEDLKGVLSGLSPLVNGENAP